LEGDNFLLSLPKIQNLKNVVTLRIATEKYGREFGSIGACRIHALVTSLGIDQSKFLGVVA